MKKTKNRISHFVLSTLIAMTILFSADAYSQEKKQRTPLTHRFEVYQDVKLLTYENEHSLTAPTVDVIAKFIVLEDKFGFALNYEYADLKSSYHRLTLSIWHFERYVYKNKVSISADVDFGFMHHYDWYLTYGAQFGTGYRLTDITRLSALLQVATRPEIDKITSSVYAGISLDLDKMLTRNKK